MKLFRKVFRITKKRDTDYCPFLLEQRHTLLFFFHVWSSPEFAPPHWFQTIKEAENCVLEMYPNAVIFDCYSENKTRGGKR